jgi:hypothetical protein
MEWDIEKFRALINACPAHRDVGTRYYDGGIEMSHGLPEGSPECVEGCPGYHYICPCGQIWDSVGNCPECYPRKEVK